MAIHAGFFVSVRLNKINGDNASSADLERPEQVLRILTICTRHSPEASPQALPNNDHARTLHPAP